MKLLDCTIRDGGYYTLWDFELNLVNRYCKLISNMPIEYIEIGYRSPEKSDYLGEYYYLPKNRLINIKNDLNKSQKISLMLNTKDCLNINIENLLFECIGLVDMIRLATNPEKIDESLKIAKIVKKMGFEVGLNIMYISTLDENHYLYQVLNEIDSYIDVIYLVDSYGSIYPEELKNIIYKVKKFTNIPLGFHGHNNLELAFVNSLTAISCGVEMIDSTILGMGRGAGNLKLELLLTHLKVKNNFDVDVNILAQLVELFNPLLNQYKWGINLPYMISGSYSLPQKDVMEAIEINRYSLASIVNTMNERNNKTLNLLHKEENLKKSLIIGGGSTIDNHLEIIISYLIQNKEVVVIHSTSKFIDKFSTLQNRQFFCIAGDELSKINSITEYSSIEKYIFEPSPRKISVQIPNENNFFELNSIEFIDSLTDSPLTISLQTAVDLGSKNIELVGFDGYGEIKSKKELYLMNENQNILDIFQSKDLAKIIFLTRTSYKNILQSSIYSKLVK